MTTGSFIALIGIGLGVAIFAGRSLAPRASVPMTSRERAIEAQRVSASASQLARELTAKWNEDEARKHGGFGA